MSTMLLRLLVAWVCVWVGVGGHRLVVGEGGYARLLAAPPPLHALTLAAWVNVTAFPQGVAPILTLVAPDALTQTAFFLRHDGLGVLWGGPPRQHAHTLDRVDRHPRTRWAVSEAPVGRQRREAVDYSGGLGDFVDLLGGPPRAGRAYDTWTPYGFVDVDQMGVADLQAAPSTLSQGLHILPFHRAGVGRSSESYSDWTNVPYELAMQESGRPPIITEPSGADDFVFFNWNVPPAAPQTIPESPNQWSPIWRHKNPRPPPKTPAKVAPKTEAPRPAPHTNKPGAWTSQVTEVKMELSGWRAQNFPGPVVAPQPITGTEVAPPPITGPIAASHPITGPIAASHPITGPIAAPQPILGPIAAPQPIRGPIAAPQPIQRPIAAPQPIQRPIAAPQPIQGPVTVSKHIPGPVAQPQTIPAPADPPILPVYRASPPPVPTRRPTPASTTTHVFPTTKASSKGKPTTTSPKRPAPITTSRTTPVPTPTPITRHRVTAPPTTTPPHRKSPRPTRPSVPASRLPPRMPLWKLIKNPNMALHHHHHTATTKAKAKATTTTTTTTTTPTTPTTRPPPITYRAPISYRAPITYRVLPTTTTTTTPRPPPRSKVAVWSGGAAQKPSPARHVQEFRRAMGRGEAVRDGDTAVVYSVPITDVDAFNAMYRQYQQQETFTPSEQGVSDQQKQQTRPSEHEHNPNTLGEQDLPQDLPQEPPRLPQDLPKDPRPLPRYETVAPAEEHVLAPTEEPMPPTPPRGAVREAPSPATPRQASPTKHWAHLTLHTRGELRGDQPPPVTRHVAPKTPTPTQTTTPPPPPTTPKRIITQATPTTTLPPSTPPPTLSTTTPPHEPASGASSTFAVFHQEEVEAEVDEVDEVFALPVPGVQEPGVPAAHYQEASPLYLEQLPPHLLTPQDLPRPLATTSTTHNTQRLEELIFSADPEELVRRGLLPRPVHYVSSRDEADRWLEQQYRWQDTPLGPSPSHATNTLTKDTPKAPQTPQTPQDPQQTEGGFHFKKLPYDFRADEWYHLAFTWSGRDHVAAMYVNGRLVGTLSGVLAGHHTLPGGGLTLMGQTLLPDLTDFDTTSHFRGEISGLSVWGERLGEAGVRGLYTCGTQPRSTPALDWPQLSMRFYGQVLLEKSEALCGV